MFFSILNYLGILILPNFIRQNEFYIDYLVSDGTSNKVSSSSGDSNGTQIQTDTTINVHNPDISIKRNDHSKVAAALSSAGGNRRS